MPTASKLSQVDRHRDTALRLSSPSAHPKVGRGKFYANTEGGYTFDTMKYGKHFDTLEDAASWLNANDWEVTGAGPIHENTNNPSAMKESKLRKIVREEIRSELREARQYDGFENLPFRTQEDVREALEDINERLNDREIIGRLENVLGVLSRNAPDMWEDLHDDVYKRLTKAHGQLVRILNDTE